MIIVAIYSKSPKTDFSGPTADIKILPPKDKPKLPDPKLEEKPKKELPKP